LELWLFHQVGQSEQLLHKIQMFLPSKQLLGVMEVVLLLTAVVPKEAGVLLHLASRSLFRVTQEIPDRQFVDFRVVVEQGVLCRQELMELLGPPEELVELVGPGKPSVEYV
jgi:hypothetical protein